MRISVHRDRRQRGASRGDSGNRQKLTALGPRSWSKPARARLGPDRRRFREGRRENRRRRRIDGSGRRRRAGGAPATAASLAGSIPARPSRHHGPLWQAQALQELANAQVQAFAMELMPRITRAQVMDVLSSQANLAGYRAVLEAAAEYGAPFR